VPSYLYLHLFGAQIILLLIFTFEKMDAKTRLISEKFNSEPQA
jgi:hypothetical protein